MTPGKCADHARRLRVASFAVGGGEYVVASFERPRRVADGLTPAERRVAWLVAEGRSNREIARLRRTSVNTVGNQLAAIFRKLRVRSRFELVARLSAPARDA